jgi:hypothetical protein
MPLPLLRELSGNEFVLVAQVPRAGDRWTQVHFNAEVVQRFFRLSDSTTVELEVVDRSGLYRETLRRPLVWSEINKNAKVEFAFPGVQEYPASGRILLLIAELDVREFRYQYLLPGDEGYDEILDLTEARPQVGRGLPRVIVDLDEVELRWPGCRLRRPYTSRTS